jgi:hypothetical protein
LLALMLALSVSLTANPSIRPLKIPPGLTAVTSMPEPSGLAYSAALNRYLVVSDDTGLVEERTQHAPFVLGLDRHGQLDERPIPIKGIESLNDPEAICAGPDGTFFLATSHSPNRKGKTPANRRQLLHLKLEGRALSVIGRADLLALGGDSVLKIAGLPPDGRLDIEALAYHAGALFLGLKSPLTDGGAAILLRLADPVGALRSGNIRATALSLRAELPLCRSMSGERICQGVSDMLFLADGSLVLTANAPKGGREDGGGALWIVPAPVGTTAPVLLERFEGLRPEGIALAPGGSSVMMVFDRHLEAPLWTERPLPSPHRRDLSAP